MTGQILESVPATLRTCLYNSRATVQAVFVHPKETDLTWLRLLPRFPISDDFLVFKKGSGFTSHFAVGYAGDEKTVHFFCFFSPMEEPMPLTGRWMGILGTACVFVVRVLTMNHEN